MLKRIFVIEDDEWYGEYLKYQLSTNLNYEIHLFRRGIECLNNINLNPDVITIDVNLPGISGEELFLKLKKAFPEIPVIIISGQTEIQLALDLIRKGAYDYIYKDNNTIDFLTKSLNRINEKLLLKNEIKHLQNQLFDKHKVSNSIIGNSAQLEQVFHFIEKASQSNINVSIYGEKGTGKELVAKAIHYNSEQKKQPFVAIDVSAIPSELIESELFGFEKGAFTGANTSKKGKFEEANGGTLFLDEIAEMPLHLQSKLLRALQEKEITRLGSNKTIKLKIRLISATHKKLPKLVQEGSFREDLYYRLIGLPISLPPLRERSGDILLLANHFIKEYCNENKLKTIKLSAESKTKLLKYQYPGNVRELKTIIDLACLLSNNDSILPDNIQFASINTRTFYTTESKTLKEYEFEIILNHLKINNDNVLKTAKQLDISKSKIYNLLKEYNEDEIF